MSRIMEFIHIYKAYRVTHGRRYAARIAWGCCFKQLPF